MGIALSLPPEAKGKLKARQVRELYVVDAFVGKRHTNELRRYYILPVLYIKAYSGYGERASADMHYLALDNKEWDSSMSSDPAISL